MLENTRRYKVRKEDLLEKLRQNRSSHVTTYNRALEIYRRKAIEALSGEVAKAKDGLDFEVTFPALTKPENYSKEYDTAIGLLEFTLEDVVEISPKDYRTLVCDEWEWTPHFAHSVSNYIGQR